MFDDPSIDEIDADELSGAYPVVQYFPPGESYSDDIIARLGDGSHTMQPSSSNRHQRCTDVGSFSASAEATSPHTRMRPAARRLV